MEIKSITLSGNYATLIPLQLEHASALAEAVKDGNIWELWFTLVPTPMEMETEIIHRLQLAAQEKALPFTIIENHTGQPVGMTNLQNIEKIHRRLEIGATWYKKSVQRTAINTECKLLLLTHAFETLQTIAVEFRTHFFNHNSRRAIERLGAKLDGILRSHQIAPNGTLRDTCVYSIIACEWPTVKANLLARLNQMGEA